MCGCRGFWHHRILQHMSKTCPEVQVLDSVKVYSRRLLEGSSVRWLPNYVLGGLIECQGVLCS